MHKDLNLKLRLWLFILVIAFQIEGDEHSHKYENNEEVILWMNNVGPRHNQQENYHYLSLPFCVGPKSNISHYHETISERILGVQLEFSGLDINFKEQRSIQQFCLKKLTSDQAKLFQNAVHEEYWYEVIIDDLPGRVPVGILEKNTAYIYQHKKIIISYNENRIIEFNIETSDQIAIQPDVELKFTYEIDWVSTDIKFEDRFNRYKDSEFFQHRIHWFSICNSFVMVIFMVCFVYLIMSRVLKHDIASYNKDDDFIDLEKDLIDEYGWKQIHGDVFRNPAHPMILSALIGSGYHVAATALLCILFAIIGELYTERASFLSACIFSYSAVISINGYFGGSKYSQWQGKKWIGQMLLSTLLCPCMIFTVTIVINFLAVYYGATRSVSLNIAISVLTILSFVMLPLNLIGTLFGRAMNGQFVAPCRINPIPRPIPEKQWYLEPWILSIAGGLLPAGSVFIEVYFIFTSFWAHKVYYVFEFMFLIFFMLIIVTLSISIICTYFLLNAEDYRWHWTSFMTGASISIYVYIFSLYYYLFKTKMYGLFQTTFYFGYMGVFCSLLGIMCGTVAHTGASIFVNKIYSTIKID